MGAAPSFAGRLERAASPVVEPVDRALALPQGVGDLDRREAHNVPQDQDLALVVRQFLKRVAQILAAFEADSDWPLSASLTSSMGMARLARMWSKAALRATRRIQAVNGTSFLVFVDRRDQLGEDVLDDVFCLVTVLNEAVYIAVQVRGIANVEEMQRLPVAVLGVPDGLLHESAVRCRPSRPLTTTCHFAFG